MLTDLLGDPISVPMPLLPPPERPQRKIQEEEIRKREEAQRKREAKRYEKAVQRELENPTLWLFEEVMAFLRRPTLSVDCLPPEFRNTDRRLVDTVPETGNEVDPDGEPAIEYAPWGKPWLASEHQGIDQKAHQLKWSRLGVLSLQNYLFWESMEEMTLHNNEHEKWSVLKWIFMPAIRKYYVWDKRIGRSHCLVEHERDQTFSFHNCAMAARIDEDAIRDGFRRNLPAEIMKAVEQVCKFEF